MVIRVLFSPQGIADVYVLSVLCIAIRVSSISVVDLRFSMPRNLRVLLCFTRNVSAKFHGMRNVRRIMQAIPNNVWLQDRG